MNLHLTTSPPTFQAGQNAQADIESQKLVASIRNHRQGNAHHRQKPQAHADIDGALREKEKGQPAREQTAKIAAGKTIDYKFV